MRRCRALLPLLACVLRCAGAERFVVRGGAAASLPKPGHAAGRQRSPTRGAQWQRNHGAHEAAIRKALSAAQTERRSCPASGKMVCRYLSQRIVHICADVAAGGALYTSGLRRHALSRLRDVAARGLDDTSLARAAAACRAAAASPDVPQRDALHLLEAMTRHAVRSAVAVEEMAEAVAALIRRPDTPDDRAKSTLVFEATTMLLRFAGQAAADPGAGLAVVRAARLAVEAAAGEADCAGARIVAAQAVKAVMLHAGAPAVFDEALAVAEHCAMERGEPTVLAASAWMLGSLAERVSDGEVWRVVRLCASKSLIAKDWTPAAVYTVVGRLLDDGFHASASKRVQLVAWTLAIQEHMQMPLPCIAALAMLYEHRPPDPPAHEAWRHFADHGSPPPLPLDVALQIDDLAPQQQEERSRSLTVSLCARWALQVPSYTGALARAACAMPRRIGLQAAQALASVISAGGAVRITPEDFAAVGRCLADGLGEATPGAVKSGGATDYLRSLDASAVERIASTLLGAAAALGPEWRPDERGIALRPLCALAGHDAGHGGAICAV